MPGPAIRLAPLAVQSLGATLRIRARGAERLAELRAAGRPVVLACWHGCMLPAILHHRGQGIDALVSLSRDGDVAAAVVAALGYRTVRGSSSRGGNAAYHELVERLRRGGTAAVIPDGPRGPDRVLKPGVVYLAQETGAAVVPLAAWARPAGRLASWDRFLVPWPFARAAVAYGEPLSLARDAGADAIEAARSTLEERLHAAEREARLALE